MMAEPLSPQRELRLRNIALLLSAITVTYNIVEGLVAVFFGIQDDTLALLGFGVDSFVEVISGVGIGHMVWRMKRGRVEQRDQFERQALRITGSAFYILTIGLVVGSLLRLLQGRHPETTLVGVLVSSVSILTMYGLMRAKLHIGRTLSSDAIVADAQCTRTCFYLSFILLASSTTYELLHIGVFDVLGSLGIAWFAVREGREAFEKSRSREPGCGCGEDGTCST